MILQSMRAFLRLVTTAVCISAISATMFGQGSEGRILGAVTDQSGGSVPGAKVTVLDVDRGTSRTLTTDAAGSYNAPNLTPGNYSVKVEYTGFKTFDRKEIALSVGQEVRIDATLTPGQQVETVTVTGEPPPVNTTSAVLGGTLQPGTIQDLPLNGRNFMNLLALRPGVTIYPGGGAWTQTTNGLRPEHNVYLLDGITAIEPLGGQSTINSVSLAGDSATILPLDTIQEFSTQQNPKAEFGWKPGSITSIALKSGTNTYHGTANAFGRTDVLDSRNAFLTTDPLTGKAQKQEIALENYGGTFGGPIKRDKLFFFGAYEAQQYLVGNPASFTYPSVSAATAACKANGANNSATSLKMAGLNADCSRNSGYSIFDLGSSFAPLPGSSTVVGNLNTDYSVKGGMGKVDYNLNDKNTINGKYFYGTHRGTVVNNQTITQPYWRPTDWASVQFFGGQWNYIASSSVFNTFRVGYNRFYQTFETSDCPGAAGAPDYGVNFGYGTEKPNCGFTNVVINAYSGSIGCCSSFPKYYGPDNILEFIDGLSWLRGNHSFKVGGEFRNSDIGNGGTFNRGRGQTTFATLATFLSGTPSGNGQILVGDPRRNLKQKAFAGYFQDDWRVVPRVTINLGIRYEYLTPLTEGNNQLANFIPGSSSTTSPFVQLGVNADQMYNPDKNNFAPRIGVAWDVRGNGKTVIRAGATQMYVTPGWWIFVSQQNANNPTTGLSTNPSGFPLCLGATSSSGSSPCANGVTQVNPIGNIAAAGVPLTPAQINWNQTSSLYSGAIYPASTDTSVLKCGTNRLCTAQATDPNLKNAYVYSWSLGLQQVLTPTLTLDMGYVGNHSNKLIGLQYTNTPFYGSGYCMGYSSAQIAQVSALGGSCPNPSAGANANATAAQVGRPLSALYPYLSYIYTVQNLTHSNYNGLQAVLTQRPTKGLNFTIGYTFAHALDQSSGERGGPTGTPFDFRHDYGNSDFDIRHRFTATTTYALPSKKGYAQLMEGWRLTSIITIQSALPWGIAGSRGGANDVSGTQEFNDTWNFSGSPSDFSGLQRDSVPYIAGSAAIATPACVAQTGGPGSLSYVSLQKYGCFVEGSSVLTPPAIGGRGNAVRNMFRGNPIHVWDASIMKDFKFGERVRAQFRIEAFNILNQVQYGNPQYNGAGGNTPFTNPGQFGQSQATPDVSNNNPSLGSGGPREFQLGLKINF